MPALSELIGPALARPHVVIVLGKGGVGKTTVSILLADELSRRGRTLLVSMDPAMHLLEYLRLPKAMAKVRVGGGLWALQLDVRELASKASSEYAELLRTTMPGLTALNIDDVVKAVRSAPGFEEEVLMRALADAYSEREFDYVVVDTPPTGLTFRILNLPRLYVFWVEQLMSLRERIASLKYVIARTLGRSVDPRDPVLAKLRELRERYAEMASLLADGLRTSYVIVATPEPLPVHEAKAAMELLGQLGAKPKLLVLNRVLPRDLAAKLGVLEVQEKMLSEVRNAGCTLAVIMQHRRPPRSLEEVRELAGLLRVEQE